MKLLDLAKFEKVKEDKDTTTMRHKDGHEMTILHAKLPKIHREQLKRLALYKGGDVQKFDDGGAAQAAPDPQPNDTSSNSVDLPTTQATPPVSLVINNAPPAAQPTAQPPQPIAPAPQAASVPVSGEPTLAGEAQKSLAATEQQQEAAKEGRDIQIASQNQLAPTYKQQTAVDESNLANIQQAKADMDKHGQEFADWVNQNPRDSQKYYNSLTDSQKADTALGLFLGGLGGGGRSNLAMDQLNHIIDRNVADQQANYEHERNVFGAYQQLYDNANVSAKLTKEAMNNLFLSRAAQVANNLATPIAQKQYNDLAAKTAIENNQLRLDSAGIISSMGPQASLTNGSLNPEQMQTEADENHILTPGSINKFKSLAYTPKAKEDLPAIQHQYNQAVQAEKGLGQIDDVYDQLYKNVEQGSIGGNLRRKGAAALESATEGQGAGGLGSLIGGAAAGGLKYLTDTPANMAYDSNQSKLLGFVSSALKGTNIGQDQIAHIVSANSPERGDTPALKEQKKKAIKDFIKNHTETSLLKTWGLSKE